MKRYRNNIALLLLAIYLPMWLLSSFHVHACPSDNAEAAWEHHSSTMDEDGCLLCQFLQLAYEETPQVAVTVIQSETMLEPIPVVHEVVTTFEQSFSSRAPPVLL